MRRGTGLMAHSPTGTARPGLVTLPMPMPPRIITCSGVTPVGADPCVRPDGQGQTHGSPPTTSFNVTVAWILAPLVTSGSSPASLMTKHEAALSPNSWPRRWKLALSPPGSVISTSSTTRRSRSINAAPFAAAAAQAPVVKPYLRFFLFMGSIGQQQQCVYHRGGNVGSPLAPPVRHEGNIVDRGFAE